MSTTYWGAVAEFDSAAAIYAAAKQVKAAGYSRADTHTPFPIHGMDDAIGHGPSHVGWICVACGLLGIAGAQLMMWWMNAVDYEYWVSGKLPYAWPSTVPITFECMVLLAAFGAFFGQFGLNRLPRLHHPLFDYAAALRVSDDRFVLSIDAADPKFDQQATLAFLRDIGGKNVELIAE
jgi:hypothetical protein